MDTGRSNLNPKFKSETHTPNPKTLHNEPEKPTLFNPISELTLHMLEPHTGETYTLQPQTLDQTFAST